MSASLFSSSWYLVSELKVRLRGHTEIHRHRYRGQIWYVLQDKVTGQYHRFSVEAYQIIGLFDGQRTINEIWEVACQKLGDSMPSQDEIIVLLSKLFQANVLLSDVLPDVDELAARQESTKRKRLAQKLMSPLGIRIPLVDPENFLNRTIPYVRHVFSTVGLIVWLAVVGSGLLLASIQWGALTGNITDQILSLENVLLMVMVYPVVKLLHEFGHAYAVKRWGGEVHEMGVMLLVFFPVPYVDASAASSFQTKYQRMLVGAAGILVEAFIAALAMILWTFLEPGTARSIAFNTMTLAGVSTLLFNGNPLLKFDAYYVLTDYLEIPNLSIRANQYINYFTKRYAFGVTGLVDISASKREAAWMVAYGVLSYIYRMFVMFAIAMFIAGKYLFIGVALAFWSVYTAVVSPLIKMLVAPFSDYQLQQRRRQVITVGSLVLLLVVLLLGVIPFPYSTLSQGVFVPSENSQVRAEVGGFIKKIYARNGQPVNAGDLLVELEEPGLNAEVEMLKALVKEAEVTYQSQLRDRTLSEINRELLRYRQGEYLRVLERKQSLRILSSKAGEFVMTDEDDWSGKYLRRGDVLGFVVDFSQLQATVLVRKNEIDEVRNKTASVDVRLVSNPRKSYVGLVDRIFPVSSKQLPSEILSTVGGGSIALNPQSESEPQAFSRHYTVVVGLQGAPKVHLNERAYVLFKHESEPLMYRWLRDLRRVFLRQLDV